MGIGPEEAARALRDAEDAADRSQTAAGYQNASHYLVLWGVIWTLGNVAAFLRMSHGTYVFTALMLAGTVGSVLIGRRTPAVGGQRRSSAVRALTISGAMVLFSFGVGRVAEIRSFATAEAVICMALGAAYMVMGTFIGWRLAAVGAIQMIAVILGWTYAREQFFLWMALAGGGGLILGGLWLRKA